MIYYEIFVYVVKMCFSLNIHINAMRWRKLSFLSSRFFRFALIHYLEFWFLCVCSFVRAQLFQLKIIYFEVHWVSYQDERYFFLSFIAFCNLVLGKNDAERYMHRYVEECFRILNGKLWPSF